MSDLRPKHKVVKELLSFDDPEDEPLPVKHPRLPPNPEASPEFIPNCEQTKAEQLLREQLQQEYLLAQEKIKDEIVEIPYMYWDGSNNRYHVKVRKRTTISEFLAVARDVLVQHFPELKKVSSDHLIFVKGDIILPQSVTFYDLIVNNSAAKSGTILAVRKVESDGETFDRDESHVGKILERKWYEKNKHIFPASQWELYDPTKDEST